MLERIRNAKRRRMSRYRKFLSMLLYKRGLEHSNIYGYPVGWCCAPANRESFEKYVKFLLEIGELEEDGEKLKLSEKVKFKDGSEKSG